jgi:hypothetical protein
MARSIEALFRACRDCGSEAGFEQPPCAEDHGPDCPEWFCLECGSVLWSARRSSWMRALRVRGARPVS